MLSTKVNELIECCARKHGSLASTRVCHVSLALNGGQESSENTRFRSRNLCSVASRAGESARRACPLHSVIDSCAFVNPLIKIIDFSAMDISPSITPNMLDIDLEDPSRPHTGSMQRNMFLARVWYEVKEPLLRFSVLWIFLSLIAAFLGFIDAITIQFTLLVGSLLSIGGTVLVIFSGYMGNRRHREVFHQWCSVVIMLLRHFNLFISLLFVTYHSQYFLLSTLPW